MHYAFSVELPPDASSAPAPVRPAVIGPVVIGIAGCSGSGKTTLAHELARQLDATVFPLDLYYRDLSHFPFEQRDKQNFDHPDSLESELFIEHIRTLKQGQSIQRPVYDFSIHSRVPGRFEPVHPQRYLVVEGILGLHYEELLPLYDFSIYVDAPNAICLRRRIYRDMRERGRTEESVIAQFEATARPMAELYVVPSQERASIVVQGTEALDWSIELIFKTMKSRGLLDPLPAK
ncbi:uridine kinase [Bryocella elongata]|uniref:uridine/cytidine kinase n=2 Tax=Bryocella elongata TaxID=863522 RepID=A0A1H5X020_9BACT|nr:uridine kinase [Bryocella elongata]